MRASASSPWDSASSNHNPPQGAPDWSGLMAATIVAAVPILILFLAFGKKVVNSIGFSGIK